jgi:hypothetical protein
MLLWSKKAMRSVRSFVLAGVLTVMVGSALASDELGYTEPINGVPWHPPVRIDFDQLEKEAAAEAMPSARERCLKRAGTALVGEKLMCATRASLENALRQVGAKQLAVAAPKDVLVYDARALWPGSAYLSVGFTGQRFSVADIAYPPVAGWYEQLYRQLAHRYGKPKRVEGSPFGAKGVMWQRDDSIQVWLHQPQPNVVLVSYVRPDMYQYWTRPRLVGK